MADNNNVQSESIETLQRVVEVDPKFPFAELYLARALTFAGRPEEAIPLIGLARRALARADPQASRRELDVRFVELHYGRHIAEDLRADLERRDREPHPGA